VKVQEFAWEILACEILVDMSNEPPRAIIEKLTEHYVKGIEMFANLEDQRFEFFKQRLDLLRIKPSVLRVLAADTDTQLAAQDKAKKVQAGHKRTQFLLNVAFGQEEESQKVDSIMRDLHEHTRQIEEKITMDLGRQAETLKARLSQRRKCKTKADSVCAFMDKSSPDRPSKIIRKYKHRIEGGVLLRTKSLTHERGGR
jgi:hypothetical protein